MAHRGKKIIVMPDDHGISPVIFHRHFGDPIVIYHLHDVFSRSFGRCEYLFIKTIITEFGADAVSGMHSDPPVMFSEEYQRDLIDEFTKVFDKYSYVAGEHVWNFADFLTKQGLSRVIGNKKGVFTRERQPKLSAHFLKERWHSMDSNSE